ncbi:MAG: hypothetical protein K2H37_11425 [Lachnospiraceae bacterium]|nr:hypothetical protein [Lachnospiraceae bacterium]
MSSSEEYLDSLLDSILGGGKPDGEESDALGTESGDNQAASADGGKAMSSQEIEEMLMSMGTLGGAEEETQNAADSETDDMEAMLAFMNEHNAGASVSGDEELSLDDLSLDDLDLGESGEAALDDLSLDGLSLDDLGMEDGAASGDLALGDMNDGGDMSDGLDGLSLDDLSLDDLDLGESSGETALDDLSLDGLSLDDLGMEEGAATDNFALEDTEAGAGMSEGMDGLMLDDLSLDDLSLDDLGMEEGTASNDFALEDTEAGAGMSGGLDGFSLDDLSLEEPEGADGEMDGLMSEEDIDRLLSGDLSDGEGGADGFALEETGESDDDLSSLLAGMDHDEALSEINDLLEESDQGVSPDDDMLAMLEGVDDSSFDFFESDEAAKEAESIRELTPEEIAAREGGEKPKKEKKKRKKLFGKKKKEEEAEAEEKTAAEEPVDELEALLAEGLEQEPESEPKTEEKKPGVFARLMNFLLEADEDDEDPVAAEVLADNDGEMGTVTDENRALLEELSEEDKKGKKKKKKDKKKGKKGKAGEEGEEEAEGEEEDNKKAKKKKKKVKKKKEEAEEVDLFAPPEKKLSKKKVISVFMFCGTIAACIILLVSFLPNYMEKREAQVAYDYQNYAEVYDLLYGKELSEQDEILFQRSNLILQMNRKLSSYQNYSDLDMRLESLNALISGVARYQVVLPEAETYNVVGEVSGIYAQILERLSADFGVSEQDALEIIAVEDDVIYSQRLEAIINGAVYDEDVPAGRQDILPEEEEIIERIDGLEADFDEEQPQDAQTDEIPEEDMLPEEMPEEAATSDENAGEDISADENTDERAE